MEVQREVLRPINELPRMAYPVKVLQFGSGNFLRGFVDWMIQVANEKTGFNAGVSVIQNVSNGDALKRQDGVYTVVLKGIQEGEFVSQRHKIDVIQRVVDPVRDFESFIKEASNTDLQFIVSNTTESGIVFSDRDRSVATLASTFPGKLTQLLYKRFREKIDNPLLVLPTELIEQNGSVLKSCIQKYSGHWSLPTDFNLWLNKHVTFCDTLVDRVVSGFPKKDKEVVYNELGYTDDLVVEGEWFHLWAIEGPRWIGEVLPFRKAGLNVIYTSDLAPYRLRKVLTLNGAHTCMAVVGSLAGLQTVREAIEHPVIGKYLKRVIFDDIVPNIPGDLIELKKYAEQVISRFRNPSIDHQLQAIRLNSFSKFAVRVLPSLLSQKERNGIASDRLVFALASLLYLYGGLRNGRSIPLNDNPEILERMATAWSVATRTPSGLEDLCKNVLSKQEWWGRDLTLIPNLISRVADQLLELDQKEIEACLNGLP
jgi:tagaturonate reductase